MTEVNARIAGKALRSRVAWGSIFAGALVAVVSFLILGSLWAAINLSLPWEITKGASLWATLLTIAALFIGGRTTARLAIGENLGEAVLHGALMWAVTALILVYLAINGILILGTSTVLGQKAGDDLMPMATTAAWWGFAGVASSLVAGMLGALSGCRLEKGDL